MIARLPKKTGSLVFCLEIVSQAWRVISVIQKHDDSDYGDMKSQPRHWATAFGRGPHGGAGAFGWAGCRPHRGGCAGATGCARGAPRGFTLIEAMPGLM